ncbi:MAG: hypothetical protein WCV69_01610 [Patescibacteria group bacterium]|jgi:hypothetical protein
MLKKKQMANWPLSTLIVIVSFLSVLVVLRQVQAAWVEPNYLPSNTSLLQNFVFTPLAQDLDLGTRTIVDADGPITLNDDVSVNGNLLVSGTINGVSGGGASLASDWAINYSASRALYYTTTTPSASGNVGIGTNSPSHRLHVLATAQNAEIDIQTGGAGGDDSHWGIYHDSASNDLRFWKGNENRVTFADTGEVAINTTLDTAYQLLVRGNTKTGIYASTTSGIVPAISGYNDFSGFPNNGAGVRGEANTAIFVGGAGVYGRGYYGVKGEGGTYGLWGRGSAVSTYGVYGTAAGGGIAINGVAEDTGSLAGQFTGAVNIGGNLTMTSNFFKLVSNIANPLVTDCDSNIERGRVWFRADTGELYICSTNTLGGYIWKKVVLN